MLSIDLRVFFYSNDLLQHIVPTVPFLVYLHIHMSSEQKSSFFDYFKIYGGKTSSFGTVTVCHHRQCCGPELLEPSLPVTAPAPSS